MIAVDEDEDPVEDAEAAAEASVITKNPVQIFTIAAFACALVGLVLATISHLREKHTILTLGATTCCAAAITWQYLAIGIAVGAAAAIFVWLMSHLGARWGRGYSRQPR